MKASATKKNGILHFYFDGELDEHAARLIRRQTDAFIDDNAANVSAARGEGWQACHLTGGITVTDLFEL